MKYGTNGTRVTRAAVILSCVVALAACSGIGTGTTQQMGSTVNALEWEELQWQPVERLPEGAELISEEEARSDYARGWLQPTSRSDADIERDRLLQDSEDSAILEAFFERNPGSAEVFQATVEEVGEASGNGVRSLKLTDKRGQLRSVALGDASVLRHDLARSIASANDRDNVWAIYARLFTLAEGTRTASERELPTPAEARDLSLSELKAWMAVIAQDLDAIRNERYPGFNRQLDEGMTTPQLTGDSCVGGFPADQGDGLGTDLRKLAGPDFNSCSPSTKGLFFNDKRGYKEHLSCVRDQGSRGSCVAFAAASAMEMGHSIRFDSKVNLSEQRLYYQAKRYSVTQKDGLHYEDVFSLFSDASFAVPYENAWNYNPSRQRTWKGGDGPYKWQDSCVGYAETCSDTVHQGKHVCYEKGTKYYCGWRPQKTAGPGLRSGAGLELWDSEDPELSILLMKAAIFSGSQLIVEVMVNESFYKAIETDGYIRYKGEDQSKFGFHALHVVSYIDNDDLAALLPDAPPGGDGGYFIVRNSWGPCMGDGGYLYIPYRWMKPKLFTIRARQILPETLTLVQ